MAKYQSKESVAKHARPTDNAFLTELRQFHESRGTPFRGTPSLNGRVVNLSVLYHEVTTLGGWRKVNDSQKWDTVVAKLNFPRSCANAGLALKQFYIRYLDHYEKIHFLGEDPDDDGLDSLDHPSRKTQSIAYLVPLSYNHHQHEVSESVRNQCGLSVDFSTSNDYDKLSLSLQSGFPNEVDFALNVCTLLSNEGRHTLRLQKNPRLVDLLISHAGVWTESNVSLKELLEQHWEKMPGRQMSRFWDQLIDDKELRELYFNGQKQSTKQNSGVEKSDDEIFNMGRELGVRESEGQRVLQVATILWNLSFEECNVPIIASSLACLKFLFLCINAKWSNLRQLALETLGNIAGDINLEPVDCLNTQVVFRTLAQCLGSSDRFLIIRGLEILTGLCKVENNEETIIKSLERKIYERICNLLTIHDIMILIYTLECLYHLTDLGADVCSNIVCIHKVIEILINLITVEAQSYGPAACISMKVIETAPPVQPVVTVSTNQRPQPAPPPTQRTVASPATVHGYQEADNDTFAYNWLKAYYEWHSGSCVSQNELYVNYQTTCNKLGKKGLVPPSQLLNLLKSLYPQLKTRQEGIRSDVQLEGIRRRAVTLPVSIYMPTTRPSNTANATSSITSPRNSKCIIGSSNSPILKAQLSAPPRGSSTTTSTSSSGAANSHPHLQQALLGRSQPSATKPTAATPPSTTRNATPSSMKDSSTLIKSLLANKVNQNMLLKKQQLQSTNGESASIVDTDGRVGKTVSTSTRGCATLVTVKKSGKECSATSPVRPRSPKSRLNGATRSTQLEDRMFQVCANVEQAKDLVNSTEFHGARIERVENHLDKRRLVDNDDEPTLDKLLRSSGVRSLQNGVLSTTTTTTSTSQQNGNRSESDSPNFVTMEASPPLGSVGFVDTPTTVRRKGVLADLLEGKVHKDTLLTMNGIVDRGNNKSTTTTTNLVFATKSVPRTNGDATSTTPTTTPKTVKVILPVTLDKSASTLLTDWSSLPSASKVIVPNKSAESEELIGFPRVSMEQLNQLRQQSKTGKRPGESNPTGHEAKRTRVVVESCAPKDDGKAASAILSASEVQQQVSAALSFADTKSPTVVAVTMLENVADEQCEQSPTSSTVKSTEVTTLTTSTSSTTTSLSSSSTNNNNNINVNNKCAVAIKSDPSRRNEKSDAKVDFICEWKDCMKSFTSPMAVFAHACKSHVPENSLTLCCLWESCDQMARQRLSLITHLQDRHCNDNMLRLQATRRQQLAEMGSSTIPPPAPPPPHPGYAPNAAVQAIRRHALEFMAQKDKLGADEKEGPVTKSIRLTAALILRNLVMYSALARSMVKKYESNLSIVAMSNVESSRTVAQCLWELNRQHDVVHVR